MNDIIPYKDRKIDRSKPIELYRCLNRKGKVYSIRQDGKVVGHTSNISLTDVNFIINKSGQIRCRKSGERNVHAYVKGYISSTINKYFSCKIKYNPYVDDNFYYYKSDNKNKIEYSPHLLVKEGIIQI